MSVVTVKIQDLTIEGVGIGFIGNKKIFVDGALPEETVTVEIILDKENYAQGQIKSIDSESPYRVQSFCSECCGGCSFKNFSYTKELSFKANYLLSLFKDLHSFSPEKFHGIEEMKSPFRYRNKAIYMASYDDNIFNLGLYEKGSHKVVNINDCLLEQPWMNEIRNALRKYIQDANSIDVKEFGKNFRYLFLRGNNSFDRQAVIITRTNRVPKEIEDLLFNYGITNISININDSLGNSIFGKEFLVLRGNSTVAMSLYAQKYSLRPNSFFQINTEMTEVLYKSAIDLLEFSKDDVVLDLYSGIGTISFQIAPKVSQVIGIECVQEAVNDAKENAKLLEIKNADFFAGYVEEILPGLINKYGKISSAILDPARKGGEKSVLDTLKKSGIEKFVYVSCNPKSLKRDLVYAQEIGYKIEYIKGFDMFPHTAHVETVVLLSKVQN